MTGATRTPRPTGENAATSALPWGRRDSCPGTARRDRARWAWGGRGLWRPCHWVALCLVLVLNATCSGWLSGESHRKDVLEAALRSFHLAFIRGDSAVILRHMQADRRPPWREAFPCLFRSFRFLDYRVEDVSLEEEAREAEVRVMVNGHRLDSLGVKEMHWTEHWTFDDRRWIVAPDASMFQGIAEDCLPASSPPGGGGRPPSP